MKAARLLASIGIATLSVTGLTLTAAAPANATPHTTCLIGKGGSFTTVGIQCNRQLPSDRATVITFQDGSSRETWWCLNDPPVYFFVSPASTLAQQLRVAEGNTYVGTHCTQLSRTS
ncbi:hypothetical protein A8W25_24770 [Streptomyces sp. ERV7]|uniref:hypothetical protein n=1 Tax=Streptomyces sp. ERV7 TaxID=1322334 RepID=UPI0007F49650|nr:hypothetical protein [Streptomyces sp. ERV7]OAR22790.1 hypothetical protein A8W25_24770 [Streptomyces sp. ERV7]